MNPRIVLAAAAVCFAACSAAAEGPPGSARPKITGISHVALWIGDLARSRGYYRDYLGFEEPYHLDDGKGGVAIAWIKINDRQTIELFPPGPGGPRGGDCFAHLAFETDDAQGMLDYLRSRGVHGPGGKPLPATAKAGRIGNLNYFAEDPDGHTIEFMQYLPGGWTRRNAGLSLPQSRIAARISHAGLTSGDLGASLAFYRDILGFRETWRGSSDGKQLSWVNLRVPDGEDYVELMLYSAKPDLAQLHILNHLCLEVPDAAAAEATLRSRALPQGCQPPTPLRLGINRRRQVNSFDPDGTRVELMEPGTVDGGPAPSSDAPPPVRQ